MTKLVVDLVTIITNAKTLTFQVYMKINGANMKIRNYLNIQAYLHEFATHNVTLDMLQSILNHHKYELKKINFIKKFEVEILVTSLETNKTYKIKN